MSVVRLSQRYAKSLVDLAREKNELEKVYEDATLIQAINDQSRDFKLMLKSPVINSDKKQAIIDAVIGDRICGLTKSFIELLIRKGRESYLTEIGGAIIDQYKDLKGIQTVQLTTAAEVSDEVRKQIVDKVGTDGGSTIDLNTEVDPELIGGFVLNFNDQLYDASVSRQLSELRKTILDESYIAKL